SAAGSGIEQGAHRYCHCCRCAVRRVPGSGAPWRPSNVIAMPMRVAGAQLNLVVGDLAGNEARIAAAMDWGEEENADVLLPPELAVTGYPPEDLVLRPSFVEASVEAVRRLGRRSGRTTTVVGFVDHASPAE